MKVLYGNPNGKIDTFVIINVNNPVIQFRDNVDYTDKNKRKRIDILLTNVNERNKELNKVLEEVNYQFIKLKNWTYLILNENPKNSNSLTQWVYIKGYILISLQDSLYTVILRETDGRSYPIIHYKDIDKTTNKDLNTALNEILKNHSEYNFENIDFNNVINNLQLTPCFHPEEYKKIITHESTKWYNPRNMTYPKSKNEI